MSEQITMTDQKEIKIITPSDVQPIVFERYTEKVVRVVIKDIESAELCIRNDIIYAIAEKRINEPLKCGELGVRVVSTSLSIQSVEEVKTKAKQSVREALIKNYPTLDEINISLFTERYWVLFERDGEQYIDFVVALVRLDDTIVYNYEVKNIYI